MKRERVEPTDAEVLRQIARDVRSMQQMMQALLLIATVGIIAGVVLVLGR